MPKPLANKVILIGWDAADWKVIHPLLDAGQMPHLARLVEQGVMGNLATLHPPLSPILWTSIATGKRPYQHGILGFHEPDPHTGGVRPISNLSRKTKALWNILSQVGRKSVVVAWWPSHPAEPINGVMVSNHYQRAHAPRDAPWPMRPGTVHPERLTRNLAGLRLHPQDLDPRLIELFVPRAAEIDQTQDHRLEGLARIIADCTTVHRAAKAILQYEPWDFAAIYFDALDHFGHGFMKFHPPRRRWVDERSFELYQGVIAAAYRYHDLLLGDLLAVAGPEPTVILVSDHGFHPDHLRPDYIPVEPAGPAAEHRPYGILVMHGPGIKRDELVYGANLLDICPTILTLLGLPVGADMDGQALVQAFTEPGAPIESIPSWDAVAGSDGMHSPDVRLDPVESHEALRQLVALGYIEEPAADAALAVENAVSEMRFNLARAFMDARRFADAAPVLEELLARRPDEYRFGIQLAQCYQMLGRLPAARSLLEELFRRKEQNQAAARAQLKDWKEKHPEVQLADLDEGQRRALRRLRAEAALNPYAMEYLMGSLRLAEGDAAGALTHLRRAEKTKGAKPGLNNKLGAAYLELKKWTEAERLFRRTLAEDADNAAAWLGICRARLGQRRNMEAAAAALKSVGLVYHNPAAHYFLGVALQRMRRAVRAVESFKVAVAQQPGFTEAYRRLAQIARRRFGAAALAERYLALARQSRTAPRAAAPPDCAGRSAKPSAEAAVPATAPDPSTADPEGGITVVAGLPRSGTSLMMQMLAAGGMPVLTDDSRPPDADNPRGYFEFAAARSLRRDRTWVPQARGKAVKIIAHQLAFLPGGADCRYRVIFMERDLDETLASQKKMLQRHGRMGARMADSELKQTYTRQLGNIRRRLAARGIPLLPVSFKDCIEQPLKVAADVQRFLGRELNLSAMAAVVAPELYRQRLSAESLDIK